MNVYRRALEIINERGWHRGGLSGQDGAVCLVGAVGLACGLTMNGYDYGNMYANPALKPLGKIADELFPTPGNANYFSANPAEIYAINDDMGREAVEQLLEKAAIRTEEEI